MEEWIGRLWHRCATRAADGARYPAAAARLEDMARPLGVFFRALGGDPGLRLTAATQDHHGRRRRWLARLAGSAERLFLARCDQESLRLPPIIDVFPESGLNRSLYYWLAALAASRDEESAPPSPTDRSHFLCNQAASARVLRNWPGLAPRYWQLVAAYLPRRIPPQHLPQAEAQRESAIRQALQTPGSIKHFPELPSNAPPAEPVLLWLQSAQMTSAARTAKPGAGAEAGGKTHDAAGQTHKAERLDAERVKNGLLLPFRAESLLALAEFFKLDRCSDDEENPDIQAARDLEYLSLTQTQDQERLASKVRFDLDLPTAAEDEDDGKERPGPSQPFPEWDYRESRFRENHAFVQDITPRRAAPAPLPPRLARTARHLRERFAALRSERHWLKTQPEGNELDLDAIVRAHTDRACRRTPGENLHQALEKRERDLACLLLADLSLSTDAWVSNTARVIDVIQDALLLFGETLRATGDRFALCGFSSIKRHQVHFHRLKDFGEPFDGRIRGRLLAITPGYYTRLGAAIRRAAKMLEHEPAARHLLLILSDGKPNDLDLYDSRYGIEDTRTAIIEARRAGLTPFCLTIDRDGGTYLDRLFGPTGYAMLRKPEELPRRLPMLYAQLTH